MCSSYVASTNGQDSGAVLLAADSTRVLLTRLKEQELRYLAPPLSELVQSPLATWTSSTDLESITKIQYIPNTINGTLSFEFWGNRVGILFKRNGGVYSATIDSDPLSEYTWNFTSDTFERNNVFELIPNLDLSTVTKHTITIKAITLGSTSVQGIVVPATYYPSGEIDISGPNSSYYSQVSVVNGTNVLVNLGQEFKNIRIQSDQDVDVKLNSTSNDAISLEKNRRNSFTDLITQHLYFTTSVSTNVTITANG